MCRIIYIVESRGPSGTGSEAETYNSGDVVAVEEDGTFLGRQVEPATATSGNISVIEVPGVLARRMRYLLLEHQDSLVPMRLVQLQPGHPDGDYYERNILRRRAYGIDKDLLPNRHKNSFKLGRGISDTEKVIEEAVRDYTKVGNPPVDRGALPRTVSV